MQVFLIIVIKTSAYKEKKIPPPLKYNKKESSIYSFDLFHWLWIKKKD